MRSLWDHFWIMLGSPWLHELGLGWRSWWFWVPKDFWRIFGDVSDDLSYSFGGFSGWFSMIFRVLVLTVFFCGISLDSIVFSYSFPMYYLFVIIFRVPSYGLRTEKRENHKEN